MRLLRQALNGLLVALIPAGIVAGGLSLALLEGGFSASSFLPQSPTEVRILTISPGSALTPVSPAGEPVESAETLATTKASGSCPPPAGWFVITVGLGDTLNSLAARYGLVVEDLMQANCLQAQTLVAGSTLYVPNLEIGPAPAADETPTCGPPPGWVIYTVEPNDTLFGLSVILNVSVAELQYANCLGSSTIIVRGDDLWVPRLPSRSATPNPSATVTRTPPTPTSQTATATAAVPTSTPTEMVPSPTNPSTMTAPPPSPTPTPSPTLTLTPTEAIPSQTFTPSPSPTGINQTETPTLTPTTTNELVTPTAGFWNMPARGIKRTNPIVKWVRPPIR